jgi:UDP-N-acetyl-D-mannosaminouronate:lipid I N-acetyl-D-mannosaminouronosyltransferase
MDKIKAYVGGIEVTPFQNMADAISCIVDDEGKVLQGSAIAINAEKVMTARGRPDVKATLDAATLRYADGIGVVWALKRKGFDTARIPGCDLWEALMKRAGELNVGVFLLGGQPDVLEQTTQKLTAEFCTPIVGSCDGYFDDESDVIEQIKNSGAQIVTIALGSPKQELFIQKCRKVYPQAFYMGVGGTYDVFTGHVQRAPETFQRLHLEWFYRLLKQPSRAGRQANLVVFLFLLLLGRV